MNGRSIEFVENRDPKGCFEADVEALTYIHQNEVRLALDKADLYTPDGLRVVGAEVLNASMRSAVLSVNFKEVLPHYNGFSGDEIALDDSPDLEKERLQTLQTSLAEDDHQGLILFYPCKRPGSPLIFGHFVAAIEGQEADAALTVMDPSELRDPKTDERIGGVFQKSEEEVLEMLTPVINLDQLIPVFAYSVRINSLSPIMQEAEASAVGEIEAEPKGEARELALAL